MKKSLFGVACLLTLILLSLPAWAHKVRIFAYEDGGVIISEAKFNNGRPAINSKVIVKDENELEITTGLTDDNGIFRFSVSEIQKANRSDLTIILDLGEGHRGTWLLAAADYLHEDQRNDNPRPQPKIKLTPSSAPASSAIDYARIENFIESTIEKELAPIKRMLVEQSQKKTSLQDILGGLGYIFGIAGIAAYLNSKKKRNDQ